jgi:alpha-mannosidase
MAAERRTVTVRFATDISASRLAMDAVGGIVVRPPQRIYNPTFWPLQHFMHLRDDARGKGLALCLGMPGAASYRGDGCLEVIALRNATCERAFGLFPLLGLPAEGHERVSHTFDYAIWFTPAGDWRENGVPQVARGISDNPWDTTGRAELSALAESAVTTNQPEVVVVAVKPASRGEGVIVRLSTLSYFGLPVAVTIRDRYLKAAFLCDARERDLGSLEVQGQTARLVMPGSIATVRLVI